MAPPVFFIDPQDAPDADGIVSLSGDEARHAAQVTRMRAGESIHLVDGVGRRLEGVVHAVSRERVDVAVTHVVNESPPSPRLIVVQALAKGDRGERAVEAMTEVGVDVIIPWSAGNSVTRWVGDRADKGVAKWRSIARTAAKQSRRARIPEVTGVHSTDELDGWITGAALAVCLDESADRPLATLEIPQTGDIAIVVGPEGGLNDTERSRLEGVGAIRAVLGPSVLRTSTAGPVAAAVALARTPRWGATT